MQQISFVEFLGCMMNMCLLGYYAIMEWNSKDAMFVITYMSLMMSFTFNIFIFCYIGELVAEQVLANDTLIINLSRTKFQRERIETE
ncbi:hypothetical protein E2986_11713 [Frieseomelitta varia]|uniref:Uncharacterized protein n=1 Tax=Frieseomelitta varia TaxID=561572 RepID=A0A833VY67_9HYME|nr:hypothetical protein E2986_11713 [Frieseomelitta varia]